LRDRNSIFRNHFRKFRIFCNIWKFYRPIDHRKGPPLLPDKCLYTILYGRDPQFSGSTEAYKVYGHTRTAISIVSSVEERKKECFFLSLVIKWSFPFCADYFLRTWIHPYRINRYSEKQDHMWGIISNLFSLLTE
jgi:hypothetical protein